MVIPVKAFSEQLKDLTEEQIIEKLKQAERDHLRLGAQEDLIEFTKWTFPRYEAAPPHFQIARALERVQQGQSDRLMLLCPPRHGKSELASRRFPAYYLGRHPEKQFISASASANLAEEFGRDVRNIIADPVYGEIFKTTLAEDSTAKGNWSTKQGGRYYAVGVGGQVMGKGAHVFLIDDPFGTMEDAQSDTIRKKVWEWYLGTVYNRLEGRGAVVIINHRMHEDDLSGRLLAQQAAGGDQWDVVELKATPEAPLWPEKYDGAALARMKRNTLPRFWSALYEQNPVPDEGIYFNGDWFKDCPQLPDPKTLYTYGASDYAVTDNGGDYTVHAVVGIDPQERMYLCDLWRGRKTPDVWVDAMLDMVKQWRPIAWAEESGQIKAAVGPLIDLRMRERKTYVQRVKFPTRADKVIRCQSIRGRMSQQGLYLNKQSPWFSDLSNELLAFNAGKHDDQVDCLGLIGQLIDKMAPGKPLPTKPRSIVVSGDPKSNTATLNDLWEQADLDWKRRRHNIRRI